jgi:hypothetical protein
MHFHLILSTKFLSFSLNSPHLHPFYSHHPRGFILFSWIISLSFLQRMLQNLHRFFCSFSFSFRLLHSYRKAHHIELFKCHYWWCCWRYLHYTSTKIFLTFFICFISEGSRFFCANSIYEKCSRYLGLCASIRWVFGTTTNSTFWTSHHVSSCVEKFPLCSFIIDDYHFRKKRFQLTLLRVMYEKF